MPLEVIAQEVADAAVAAADADTKWLLGEHGVPLNIQALLFHHGFGKVRTFVGVGRDPGGGP